MDFLTGRKTHLLTGRAIVYAFFLINGDDPVHLRDGFGWTFPDASLVMNTAHLADRHGHLGAVLRAAPDDHAGIFRDQLDEPLGTGLYTIAAGHTGVWIHHRKAIHHVQGIKRAGRGTLPKPHTTVLAIHGTGKGQVRPRARPIADIFILLVYVSLDPGTAHHRYQRFHGPRRLSRDFGYGIGDLLLTGKTQVWWNIGLVDHGFGVCFTPWEAAATSLSSCQGLHHFFNLRVDFNRKLMGSQGQANTKKQADASQNGQTAKGEFD
jgi:hypothetical protein